MTRPAAPAGPGILTGKVALVTGAASGIGRATALLFAREGAAVALFDRDDAGGQSAARAIEAEQGRALFVHGDVTRDADARRAVDETVIRLGGLQILFNNAGIIRRTTILRSEAAMLGDPMDRHMAQAADVPLRRVARPEDIARAALYLASDASSFVSGAPLIVDGGFVAA